MPSRIPHHRPPHLPSASHERRAYRSSAARKHLEDFYNRAAWRKLSKLWLSENPLCAGCEARGRVARAEQVHHRHGLETHPHLALDWGNLESLCIACHNEKRKVR